MIIAIDGPAGSGKSTIARMLAEKIRYKGEGFIYINSGNLYRAITLACLREGVDPLDPKLALKCAKKVRLEYRGGRLLLDGEDVEGDLHNDEVDRFVAPLSASVPIRHVVNARIHRMAKGWGVNAVAEGRDMTTVVFPKAEFRFYLDASVDARALRRFNQGSSRLSLEEIRAGIVERDEIDRNKEEGSLKIATGVVYLDTSLLTIDQVYEKLESIILEGRGMAHTEVESGWNPKGIGPAEGSSADEGSGDSIQTQLQEEYLRNLEQLEEGQLVEGTVIQVTEDQVFVNIGYKSEGKIPISEFGEIPREGDKVTVILVTKENKHGEVIVSKQKADVKVFWKNLRQAFQDHLPVEGTVERLVKGGFEVFLGADVRAFLPISQADAQKVEHPEKMIGTKAMFYVERLYSDGKINVVVNRRKLLEEAMEKQRDAFFANTTIGDDVTGVVKSFTSFGAFIDLGGFDGLLHINDMSWGHVTRPRDFVKKGEEIRLKVIRLDPVEKRINLSLKHYSDDPWVHFEDKFHVNDIVKGRVTKLTEFGAFIEISEGIEGLAHISEFSWVKKIMKPSEIVKTGDEVECMILGYDLQAGKVSLGLKQVTANPWEGLEEKYPVGTRLTRKVVKVTNAGAFIELEEGIDGFLHGDDVAWNRKVKHPSSEFSVGQEVEFMVISVDKDRRNIRLGIKQLTEDPWQSFTAAYKLGSFVEGTVASVTDFGVFVKVPGGIEGLIHKSNLPSDRDESPDEALKKFNVGDPVRAVVVELQPERQKVAFSIRDYQKRVQQEEMSRYMSGSGSDDSTHTLGDLLKYKTRDAAPAPAAPEKDAPPPAPAPAASQESPAGPAPDAAPEPAPAPKRKSRAKPKEAPAPEAQAAGPSPEAPAQELAPEAAASEAAAPAPEPPEAAPPEAAPAGESPEAAPPASAPDGAAPKAPAPEASPSGAAPESAPEGEAASQKDGA